VPVATGEGVATMSDYPIDEAKRAARELASIAQKRELELTELLLDAVKMLREAKPIMLVTEKKSWLTRYTGLMARIDEATK